MAVVAMRVSQLIQTKRQKQGMTALELASRLGVSVSMLKKYEAGICPIPQDVIIAASRVLKAPGIRRMYLRETGLAFIDTVPLNNIDRHPVAMTAKLIEETQELSEALNPLERHLINKCSPEDLSPAERESGGEALAEFLDVLCGGTEWVVMMCDVYGYDLEELVKKHEAKCRQKGVYQPDKPESKVIELFPRTQPNYA